MTSAILRRNMTARRTFVRKPKPLYRGLGCFIAACGLGLVAVAVLGSIHGHTRDLGYLVGAVLFLPMGVAIAITQVICDAKGISYRLIRRFRLRTTRIPASEVTAISVEPYRTRINGRKCVRLVVERATGDPVRLTGLSLWDKPENRAALEADAKTILELLGVRSPDSASVTVGNSRTL